MQSSPGEPAFLSAETAEEVVVARSEERGAEQEDSDMPKHRKCRNFFAIVTILTTSENTKDYYWLTGCLQETYRATDLVLKICFVIM